MDIKDVLCTYYTALNDLQQGGSLGEDYRPVRSALLGTEVSAGRAKILAVFGGQGNTENLIEELVELDQVYRPLCRDFMLDVTKHLAEAASDPISKDYMSKGFDLVNWVDNIESRPPKEYLFTAAVSLPLVGLIQLMSYYITCRILSMTPGELRDRFVGATGHSQGIVAAAVISLSTTEDQLRENTAKALQSLFWMGLRAQQAYPETTLSPTILADSIAHGEGRPTPMLAVFNITLPVLQAQVDISNKFLVPEQKIEISLHNGTRAYVCSGPPKSLYGLNLLLRKLKASGSLNQSKIPFSERKIKFGTKFLPISSPFHCSYLAPAVDLACQDILRLGLNFNTSQSFGIPVVSTHDASFIDPSKNLMGSLITQICVQKVMWTAAVTRIKCTHILDFGPGQKSGIGALTHRNVDGSGVQIVLVGSLDSSSPSLLSKRQLFESLPASVNYAVNWGEKYKPRLVRNAADGSIYIDTKFSQLLGKQPVMVAGMTPCTVDGDFVAACINAGYHVELAGGGHYNEKALRQKIDYVMDQVAPGQSVSLNVLYINPKQWSFQFPLACTLRGEGVPIEGFTIAAGIPSLETANEIIRSLRQSGVRHVAFKPGSVDGILQVVNIALQNKDCPIILQWTGGRAGGHHSYEDFHQPILDTYSAIRSCDNIILVGGSGFGDGEETFKYLDGSWSVAYQYEAMPFDGILFGSRMMIAKEGKASLSIKQTIVDASGIEDEKDWVQSYKAPVGGVVTVISELGEPIHKIATRGIMLWKELDDTVFKLPKDKRVEYLRANKHRIMKRLNDDFQKPWFGKKFDGELVDLLEMTYEEVLHRLAELLFVKHQNRWIDKSYRKLFFDFFQRVEERLMKSTDVISSVPTFTISDPVTANNPNEFLQTLNSPLNLNQLMSSEDCLYFIALSRRLGQKPVPFIPVLDESFETWFKKDSLWQSEDVDAVIDQDPQRVCILQGPVAVKHCKVVDEPVKDILDNIVNAQTQMILDKFYGGSVDNVPTVPCFGVPISVMDIPLPDAIRVSRNGEFKMLTLPSDESSRGVGNRARSSSATSISVTGGKTAFTNREWLQVLTGNNYTWFYALIFSDHIVQDKRIVKNTVSSIFHPKPGWTYKIGTDRVEVFDSFIRAVVVASISSGVISVDVFYHGTVSSSKLNLRFSYEPRYSCFPIHEIMLDRTRRIKEFYWNVWFPSEPSKTFDETYALDPLTATFPSSAVASLTDIRKFCRIVGNMHSKYAESSQTTAPMDFAIVVAWQSVIKCLFPSKVDGDLLKLVHLSNSINYVGFCEPIQAGDVITSDAEITSIKWTPTGKIVEVVAISKRAGEPILRVKSNFFFRGLFSKASLYFEKSSDMTKTVLIKSTEELAVLKSKPWIQFDGNAEIQVGSRLQFQIGYFHQNDVTKNALMLIECKGKVFLKTDTKEYSPVGVIDFVAKAPMKQNPVLHYLDRQSHLLEVPAMFEGAGIPLTGTSDVIEITTASSNQNYSDISGDHNPIHTSPLIADLAGLAGTITHGMWTSAAVRSLVETYGAENQPLLVRSYDVSFDSMVLPKDKLQTKLSHIGMHLGRKLIKIETVNQHGVQVLHGIAEVDQPRTAYIFTGQGSQEVKMGMDLYESSSTAKAIWDHADSHFFNKYGFSILDIVRNNPKSLTVYFGGPLGQAIKRNYQSMVYERVGKDGNVTTTSLFPTIDDATTSHTFVSPNGLLFATQFTQPALTLMEMAIYEDMKHRGLAGPGSIFAGHSLGEYAALASVGEVLSIETLCDIVFYRGLTMQVAVPRNEEGKSEYGMIAVNPGRVGPTFTDNFLRLLVPQIASFTHRLLEIVNYNVEDFQYVVAGELIALEILSNVLNYISKSKLDIGKLVKDLGTDKLKLKLDAIINEINNDSLNKRKNGESFELQRGIATIPLVGIDVPFHSSFLLGGVPSFRKCLDQKIKTVNVDASILRGKYVPNLTGVPFDTSLEYINLVLKHCNSEVLKDIANHWNESNFATAADVQLLARTILIELLAFQFASPVRWIETQDEIFKTFAIERLIEIGPSPVLIGMAERTLKIKYQEYDDALNQTRTLWSYAKNRAEINYEQINTNSSVESTSAPVEAAPVAVVHVVHAPLPPAPVLGASTAAPSKRYDTIPFEPEEFLRIIVALKAKKTIEEVPGSKSIKDISAGKSTLQNEIIADLQKEFGDGFPERSEELPLADLGALIKPVFNKLPGRFTSTLIAKMLSSKMPPGFSMSSAKDLLDKEFGLSSAAADQMLVYSLSAEPKTRLASDDAAKSWLRETATKFFSSHAMDLPTSSGSGGGGGSASAISSVELDKIQAKHKRLLKQQIDLFAAYVEHNLMEYSQIADNKAGEIVALQQDLDLWIGEHGSGYFEGVTPMFSWLKTRRYDSFWNWARQDVFMLYNDIIFGNLLNVDRVVTAKCLHVMNRASNELIKFMEQLVFQLSKLLYTQGREASIELAKRYSTMLIDMVKLSLSSPPVYKDVSTHVRPSIKISNDGTIEYCEVRRQGIKNFESYVVEMRDGSQKVADTWRLGKRLPHVFIREHSREDHSVWTYSNDKSEIYFNALADMAANGVSYCGRTVLMTGCGKGSIGCEILKGLLSGGAQVVVTTSSFNRSTVDFFRSIYECHGARSSCLIVAPFNQGSVQDVEALIEYIYNKDTSKGLNWDLDYVIPFGAISENGRELTDLDAKSELAHRIMLTNVLRILGCIAKAKKERRIETRPAQVILPLSPNHGVFGGDGLYGESKIGLETLLNRWHSESWSNYLTIVGAVIGWTRGTGLMNDNNLIAEAMEQAGIRTFSSNEMAFNILGLMHPKMVRMAEYAPVYADLNGGLDAVNNLAEFTKEIRSELTNSSNIKRALAKEHALEASLDLQHSDPALKIKPRANLTYAYPELKAKENLPGNPLLKDLLDLNQIVVVTGFSEVGPWGNSRTRWEMEAYGEFSLEGCVEMAWMMGLITFSTANSYTGWVDTKTKEPVADHEIKVRYESQILAHTGIRLIEPELFNGYDPNKKMLMQEVVIDYDMAPIEVSKEEADNFKLQHGAKADILENNNGNWSVRLKRGAVIYVPKALRFDRLVAGQIPTGWSAEKYGIGKDIIAQVDPITLYVLVATVEALISAGVTDPYEFYKYVHVSEVGNTSGGGEGGMLSNRGMFQSRFLDKPIAHDVLQESFINTMPAWVNLLLLSSSGPIKTPVGACATAVESVEIGMETILSGKAQVVIVGGYDDFQEESSYEFANMKATSSAVEEFAKGRQPDEMSRPTATSRAGFMESQGSGIQVLMTAALAIKMGCPIYGIVALTNTATDKEGRSIPAPGQGILTTAKCVRTPSSVKPRTLQMEYRHERIVKALQPIKEWFCDELQNLEEEASQIENETERKEYIAVRSKDIELERERRECQEKRMWGMNFWMHDNRISRIEGALAVFGLTVDDIGVASFHGTSTKANDLNESEVINKQLEHLGRTPGNVLPSIFQKYLTGHPKGAAAAWMLNGVLQVLNTGIIPGNRNADNIDEKLSGFTNLLYLSRTVHTTGIRAAILKSFGFGQVGGEVLVIHPDYLYSTLTTDQYNAYKERRCSRQAKTYRYFQDVLIGSGKLVNVKTEPPYSSDIESKVYLNPVARASFDPKKNSWTFKESEIDEAHKKAICDDSTNSLYTTLNSVIGNINNNNSNESAGVGVDVQLIKDLPLDNDNFIERNFSEVEILYCRNQPDQGSSFAGRWAAKEAVAKAICNAKSGNADFFQWKDGSGGSLKSIEIIPSTIKGGAPEVNLTGDLVKWCNDPSQYEIKASISHSGEYAIAVAIVRKI